MSTFPPINPSSFGNFASTAAAFFPPRVYLGVVFRAVSCGGRSFLEWVSDNPAGGVATPLSTPPLSFSFCLMSSFSLPLGFTVVLLRHWQLKRPNVCGLGSAAISPKTFRNNNMFRWFSAKLNLMGLCHFLRCHPLEGSANRTNDQ